MKLLKRLFDILISISASIIIFPLLSLVACWIYLDSPGPIIYRQKRVGLFGNSFFIYKFRTMVINADKIGGYSTVVGDRRITRAGKFLRKTSVDEIPQLLNVLRGDMSIVGPRPNVFEQLEKYTQQDWDKRNQVKPGITGLAQARVRSHAAPGERTKLDLEYINKQSFWFDLKIIFLTIKQVFFKGGF